MVKRGGGRSNLCLATQLTWFGLVDLGWAEIRLAASCLMLYLVLGLGGCSYPPVQDDVLVTGLWSGRFWGYLYFVKICIVFGHLGSMGCMFLL